VVACHIVHDLSQADEHIIGEGVESRWLVERDGGDVIGFLKQDRIRIHHSLLKYSTFAQIWT